MMRRLAAALLASLAGCTAGGEEARPSSSAGPGGRRVLLAGLVAPAAAGTRLRPLLVRPADVELDTLRHFVPISAAEHRAALEEAGTASSRFYANRVAHLAAVVAGTRTLVGMTERLLQEERP